MIPTPAQFAEIQKGHADAMNAYGHALFNGAERLMQLNLATGKAMLRESTTAAQSLAAVKDPQEIMALTQGGAQPAMEKIVSYTRSIQGIASAIGAELSKIAETQIAEGNRQLAEFAGVKARFSRLLERAHQPAGQHDNGKPGNPLFHNVRFRFRKGIRCERN